MLRNTNFRDPDTGEESFVHNYSFNGTIYKDKYGKQLVNKDGKPLEFIKRDEEDFGIANVGKYSMMSADQKKQVLRERARAHDKIHTPNQKER